MLSEQEDFEHLIEDLCQAEWGPESLVQMRGRRGQRQQGVDVYGQPPGWVAHTWGTSARPTPLTTD